MKTLAYLICYIVYPFSFLFVRNKKKLAFGSFRNAFNDNSKYLFIYCQNERKDLDSAWLSLSKETVKKVRSLGLKAYYTLSLKGMWHALTSKYWFFNAYTSDIMYAFSGGAFTINLWHGVGLKKAEFNIDTGELANRFQKKKFKEVFFHPESFKRPDLLLTSTPFQTKMFASAFRISESQCLEYGYPRNEILTCAENERQTFVSRYEPEITSQLLSRIREGGYRKVFVYMPTWRDSQRDIFVQSFDLNRMNEILKEQQSLLLLKPHANTIVDQSAIEDYTNIILLDSGMDSYPVLPYTDVLITDYSSILYDYILMKNKDVILYLYDYEEYVGERDFYYPFDENVVGKKVYGFDELCGCIERDEYKIDEAQRQMIVEKFWGETVAIKPSQRLANIPRVTFHRN